MGIKDISQVETGPADTDAILKDWRSGPRAAGESLFAIATTEDITAAKEAAEKLAQAYQSLEQRVGERTRDLAAVNAIAAVVSGSLNLNEILGAA